MNFTPDSSSSVCCALLLHSKAHTSHLWLWKSVCLQTGGSKGVDVSKGKSPERWEETGGELRDASKYLIG